MKRLQLLGTIFWLQSKQGQICPDYKQFNLAWYFMRQTFESALLDLVQFSGILEGQPKFDSRTNTYINTNTHTRAQQHTQTNTFLLKLV
jgi:hypothetical protein